MLAEKLQTRTTRGRKYPYKWHKPLYGLHAARKAADLSVRDLARRAGVAPATVHELEALKRTAKPDTRQRLAKALGCGVRNLTTKPTSEAEVNVAP